MQHLVSAHCIQITKNQEIKKSSWGFGSADAPEMPRYACGFDDLVCIYLDGLSFVPGSWQPPGIFTFPWIRLLAT